MKRIVILVILIAIGLAGCGRAGANQISPGQFTDRERVLVEALSENALMFSLGDGEYEASLHCYARGEWFEAGAIGGINGGGDMLFATQRAPENRDRMLPDTWTCSADGGVITGYMEWPENGAAAGGGMSHCTDKLTLEPGTEYMLAVGMYTNSGSVTMLEVGGDFADSKADFSQYDYAWVFTIRLV